MTTYPLCIFLESREQERLPAHHPFYYLVQDTLQDVIKCPLILQYMGKGTFTNEQHPDDVAEKQRVHEIIQYLQNNSLTVSGSDSPTMDSSLVETRMYSGCGNDPKNKKIARQHVYIQKYLIHAWMSTYMNLSYYATNSRVVGRHLLLTFFVRLCLLRGFITAVKLEFVPDIHLMKGVQGSSASEHVTPPCSFEHFLWEWNCYVTFWPLPHHEIGRPKYDESLSSITFSHRYSYCHVCITDDMVSETNSSALKRLAAGDWTAFPPATKNVLLLMNCPACMKVWDSPPTNGQDHKPRRIETTAWSNEAQEGTEKKFDMSKYSPRRWIMVHR